MKRIVMVAGIIILLATISQADELFTMRGSNIGPLLGFGWHDLMIGGQYEYGLSRYVGLGAIGGLSWASQSADWGSWRYTYISVGCQCNYHFIQARGWDPFLGGVLGYDIVTYSDNLNAGYYHPHNWSHTASALFLGGTAGANFRIGRTTSIQARVGYPYYLAGGLMFGM